MRISDWSSDVCSSDLRRAVQVLAEQALELAGGEVGAARQLAAAERLLQVLLHGRDHRQQLGMAHPQARRQRDALAVVLVADALVHELVGDAGGELVTVLAGDTV